MDMPSSLPLPPIIVMKFRYEVIDSRRTPLRSRNSKSGVSGATDNSFYGHRVSSNHAGLEVFSPDIACNESIFASGDLHDKNRWARQWDQCCDTIKHAECPALGKVKPCDASICLISGFCWHTVTGRILHSFEEMVRKALREQCPPRSEARRLLVNGFMVLRFWDGECCSWFHVAFVNLRDFRLALLRLQAQSIPTSKHKVFLECLAQTRWENTWKSFQSFTFERAHYMELYLLRNSRKVMVKEFRPLTQSVRPYRKAKMIWTGSDGVNLQPDDKDVLLDGSLEDVVLDTDEKKPKGGGGESGFGTGFIEGCPDIHEGMKFKVAPTQKEEEEFTWRMQEDMGTYFTLVSGATAVASGSGTGSAASGAAASVASRSGGASVPGEERADEDGWPRLYLDIASGERNSLRLSMNARGHQDMRGYCSACGATRSRTCKEDDSTGQGRPLAAIWHWMGLCCGGDRNWHARQPWAPWTDRMETRSQIINLYFRNSRFRDFLKAERQVNDRWDCMGEPRHLP